MRVMVNVCRKLFIVLLACAGVLGMAQASAGEMVYSGMADNSGYRGNMELTLSGAPNQLQGKAHWSGNLEGEATFNGALSGASLNMTGTLIFRGGRYPISLHAKVAGGRLDGHYNLDLGRDGGKQHASFSLAPRTAASGTSAPAPARPRAAGNPVEPISNGLLLTMTRTDILNKFGEAEPNFDQCNLRYPGFQVICGGAHQSVWHFIISGPGVTLNSGIGVGSSKQEVAEVFGGPYGGVIGQYKVAFSYDGDRVYDIHVDPANGDFQPYSQGGSAGGNSSPAAPAGGIAGLYWCVAPSWSKGTINLLADGSYQMNGNAAGRYTVSRGEVHFDGQLRSWNNGVGRLENGTLIFEWTTAAGARQYFAYSKGNG